MTRVERHRGDFAQALRTLVATIVGLPEAEFNRRWTAVLERSEQPWLSQTSSFNLDTWLLRLVDEEFRDFELLKDAAVHRVFFEHQAFFNRRLVGSELDYRMPNGTLERVRIEDIFLGSRLGMGYRLRTQAGAMFEIERFD